MVVYQLLDLSHKAWHAGHSNDGSIGIDICQQAEKRWRKYYQEDRKYDVSLIDNPSSRGPRRVLSLDPEIEHATRDFLHQLLYTAEAFTDIDANAAVIGADDALSDVSDSPIIGHHHLKKTKWDIAPWWDLIMFGDDGSDDEA